MIASRSIHLYFNGSNKADAQVQVYGMVKQIVVKQLTVVNSNTTSPSSLIVALKSDFIAPNQSLCNFPTNLDTNWCLPLNNTFSISNPNINSTYTFTLVVDDQTPVGDIGNLDIHVGLLMEFY